MNTTDINPGDWVRLNANDQECHVLAVNGNMLTLKWSFGVSFQADVEDVTRLD